MTAAGGECGSAPAGPPAGRRNLVALARPLFGLIVLATVLLVIFGVVAMLHMPRGIYPEVAFPRITVIAQTPGLAVKTVEIAVTRPIEEAVGAVLGVRWVRSKTIRGAAQVDVEFLARHRHGPGPERRAGQSGRHQRPVSRPARARSSSGRRRRSFRSSRSW